MSNINNKFVAYHRVSTKRQGQSGLGLEAQQLAVRQFLNGGQWEVIAEFVEVESGKKVINRPKLLEAMALCKKHKATLVIAKLDRLSRNLAFIANLMESGVDFVCCDNPHATAFTLHILAAVAEHERGMISKRTIEALAAAKLRGRKLGLSSHKRRDQAAVSASGVAVRKKKAEQYALNVLPIIEQIKATGAKSLQDVAKALNARGIKSPRGVDWHPASVMRILKLKSTGTMI